MSKQSHDELMHEIDDLTDTMHKTDQFHTLEEQVADMKRRGIDPSRSYNKWEEEDWGNTAWRKNGKWEHKTSEDLDKKARENWNGANGDITPPPFV